MIFALPLESVDNTFRYAVNGNGIDANNQLLFFIDVRYLIIPADIKLYHSGARYSILNSCKTFILLQCIYRPRNK